MSAQESRQQIIQENLPILVECLTQFHKDEENFQRCEQFAWYTIRNHKNLSVNSHEIKRKIDGMFEKFIVGNYKPYADYLKKLCNELINHPVCLNHYEVDVHWAVLDFLLNLSYNPVGSIRKNKIGISLNLSENATQYREIDIENWVNDLKDDLIPPDEYPDNSELSDWTDSGNEISMSQRFEGKVLEKATIQFFPNLIPPRKEDVQIYGGSNAMEWLIGNIQNSWWLDMYSNCNVQSCLDSAHFCYFWKKYLAEKSNNIIKLKHISTASEYCLLREIIWMFQCPTNNKFFSVHCDEIYVRDDVSICSVTLEGFRFYLESIIPYIKMTNSLRKFINSVYYYDGKPPPKIYEYYASCLQEFLDIFYTQLLNKEDRIKNQSNLDLNTVIQFQQNLNKSLEFVEKVYNIHSFVALDYKSIPAHICSAHLLAGLLLKFNLAHCPSSANMAMSLFLSTVQVFCCIVDSWWTEGQLDDFRNEFLVEK